MSRISVVVPIYNVEQHLKRCVNSILLQTCRDFELLLVDDGSIDKCGQICETYSSVDSRVIVIHQNNQGVSVARNNGISNVCGEYVTFIDGDDWITVDYLSRLYDACITTKSQISVCNIKQVNYYLIEKPRKEPNIVLSNEEAIEKLGTLMDTRFRGPVAKLVDSTIVKNHPFPKDRRYAEDAACVYLWMYDCDRIVEIPETHYYYYQRNDSAVHIDFDWYRLDAYTTFEEMLDFFLIHRMMNPYYAALCKYLHEMMDGYERCILLDKRIIANRIQEYLKNVTACRLVEPLKHQITRREELIPYLSKTNLELSQRYLSDCCYGLYQLFNQIDDRYYKRGIRLRLKKLIKQYDLSLENYMYIYEIAFQKRMKAFFLIKALRSKLKRLPE